MAGVEALRKWVYGVLVLCQVSGNEGNASFGVEGKGAVLSTEYFLRRPSPRSQQSYQSTRWFKLFNYLSIAVLSSL